MKNKKKQHFKFSRIFYIRNTQLKLNKVANEHIYNRKFLKNSIKKLFKIVFEKNQIDYNHKN